MLNFEYSSSFTSVPVLRSTPFLSPSFSLSIFEVGWYLYTPHNVDLRIKCINSCKMLTLRVGTSNWYSPASSMVLVQGRNPVNNCWKGEIMVQQFYQVFNKHWSGFFFNHPRDYNVVSEKPHIRERFFKNLGRLAVEERETTITLEPGSEWSCVWHPEVGVDWKCGWWEQDWAGFHGKKRWSR